MERAFYAMQMAAEEGADIRGIYIWSLLKNFEWNLGWGHDFGIYDDAGNLKEGVRSLLSPLASLA